MTSKKLILLGCLVFLSALVNAQAQEPTLTDSEPTRGSFGLGLGMDYGGFGSRIAFNPAPALSLFAGLGYNLVGLGYNFGAAWRISPDSRTVPYFSAMYGYNAVVVILDQSSLNQVYYGPSVAFGLEFHSRRKPKNYFNLELVLPFRDAAYKTYMDNLKMMGYMFSSEPWPVGISLGYHWGF